MRRTSPDGVARAVAARGGQPRVVVAGNFATPWPVVHALDELVPEWTLHMLNAQRGVPSRPGVRLETCFVGPGMRGQDGLSYVPSRLSTVPLLLKSTLLPDVVVLHVAPERSGLFSLGIEVNILPAAIEACRSSGGLVVAVANPAMPYTVGDSLVSVDDVDLLVDLEDPLPSPGTAVLNDTALLIGERVVSRVGDGSTIQTGIGAMPDAVVQGLTTRRDLRVWTEMFSDGVLALDKSGALDPDHDMVASFLAGSPELYAWAATDRRLRMLRTERTNNSAVIAGIPHMVSINSAIEVDLHAQANAANVRGRVHSGFGGQSDFVVGALHSPSGQALIALSSWHPRAGCSTIVPRLDQPVTSFQHTAVITEQGTAELWGRDDITQASNLIEHAAHPDARAELREYSPAARS